MTGKGNDKAVLQTLAVWVVVLLVVYLYRAERGWLYAALVFAATAVLALPLGRVFHRGWMAVADVLSRFMPALLLGAVFYIVLTPVAWLMRITRGSVVQLKPQKNSMLREVDKSFPADTFEKTW